MSYYIDFHALQSTGPANLNRDDSGSPKSTGVIPIVETRHPPGI